MELKTIRTALTPVRYFEGGRGAALVYLHGAHGLAADDPFLAALAARYHVFAPLLPGYGDGPECPELRDMLDITLHGWDVVAALGLRDPILVGHGMGGMIAAEMAAVAPREVSRLGLIAPAGLWLERHPIPDLFALMPYQYPHYLFHDETAGAARMTAGQNFDNRDWLQGFLVTNARQLGMAGKILFPIPERGLAQRLYRITARTLLIWGESDRMIAPDYAEAFRAKIAGATVVRVPQAGHMVVWECPEAVLTAVARLAVLTSRGG
jgi:pimeloyl-ACP methyl ester carboxylesterase